MSESGSSYAKVEISEPAGSNPIVDQDTFSIHYRGKACVLRNTKEFAFFRTLSRRPGIYVSVDRLIYDVWHGDVKSDSAIKTVACSLRKSLMNAGITGLQIDGRTNRRHYALIMS